MQKNHVPRLTMYANCHVLLLFLFKFIFSMAATADTIRFPGNAFRGSCAAILQNQIRNISRIYSTEIPRFTLSLTFTESLCLSSICSICA